MGNVAPIIQAIVSFGWLCFAFIALFLFKKEIAHAIVRLRKGEILGQKFELDEELEKLELQAKAAVVEVDALPTENEGTGDRREVDKLDSTIKSILQQAVTSPKIALMTLSAELEKQGRHALATRGLLKERSAVTLTQALSELNQYGFPPNMTGSLKLFANIRNKIVHGHQATDADTLSALDSGITILKAISALPNEKNEIYHPGVTLYLDEACTVPILDAKGVVLETTSPGGAKIDFRVFPTTVTTYVKGKEVAWEWKMGRTWPAAWYKDPDTGEVKSAFGASAEFVGRHLDDI
jgi:hypothetical protein